MNNMLNGMIGLIVGNALGVPVHAYGRDKLKSSPVKGMREYGTFNQPAGTWSDVGSMSLAILDSMKHGYDLNDIATKLYDWSHGTKYTPYGEVFINGITCINGLKKFHKTNNPYESGLNGKYDNGSGALARSLPVCVYTADMPADEAIRIVHEICGITHAHPISKVACGIYCFCVRQIISNPEDSISRSILIGVARAFQYYSGQEEYEAALKEYDRLEEIASISEEEIKSDGYVVNTLESVLWAAITTSSYKECVLKAVNLGNRTDSITALAGALAGLKFGIENIPQEWINKITRIDWIEHLCRTEDSNNLSYQITDIHSHLLPGVDDGASDMKMTFELIDSAESQGIRNLFLTPHGNTFTCISDKEIRERFKAVTEYAKVRNPELNLHLGREIFCTQANINKVVDRLKKGYYQTMSDTNYVLVEFSPTIIYGEMSNCLDKLIKGGWKPIIAHLERYYNICADDRYVYALIKKGCMIQINAYSLTNEHKEITRNNARRLLAQERVHFIGSDGHRTDHRPVSVSDGVKYIFDNCSPKYARDICYRNANKFLLGIDDEEIIETVTDEQQETHKCQNFIDALMYAFTEKRMLSNDIMDDTAYLEWKAMMSVLYNDVVELGKKYFDNKSSDAYAIESAKVMDDYATILKWIGKVNGFPIAVRNDDDIRILSLKMKYIINDEEKFKSKKLEWVFRYRVERLIARRVITQLNMPQEVLAEEHVYKKLMRKQRDKKQTNLAQKKSEVLENISKANQELPVPKPEKVKLKFTDVLYVRKNISCEPSHNIMNAEFRVEVIDSVGKISQITVYGYECNVCGKRFISELEYSRIKNYGVLLCQLKKPATGKSTGVYAKWKQESILHESGYTVNANSDLTQIQRQVILEKIIVNKMLKPGDIASFIGWLIDFHSKKPSMSSAVMKWQQDMEFLVDSVLNSAK